MPSPVNSTAQEVYGVLSSHATFLVKRTFDVSLSAMGLLVTLPLLVTIIMLVWVTDWHSPFYVADRVGVNGRLFRMVKLRSMVVHADRTGVDSTASDDTRITRIGRLIRRFKLDEVSQLWNVLVGDMSLVGPRPQVSRDVARYTNEERGLLSVRPGITDYASIVFADEGDILRGAPNPDLLYNQIIRPWKSRLGLHYVMTRSMLQDLALILTTLVNAVSRQTALSMVAALLKKSSADRQLQEVARRRTPLRPTPPPGASEVVSSRDLSSRQPQVH
jgi:lipopolysaccharide/colanic/teichoic acid biosynthesis glycosyltransferase